MSALEIIVIALTLAFMVSMVCIYFYKKKHKLPMGECSCCGKAKKRDLLDEYRTKYHH